MRAEIGVGVCLLVLGILGLLTVLGVLSTGLFLSSLFALLGIAALVYGIGTTSRVRDLPPYYTSAAILTGISMLVLIVPRQGWGVGLSILLIWLGLWVLGWLLVKRAYET